MSKVVSTSMGEDFLKQFQGNLLMIQAFYGINNIRVKFFFVCFQTRKPGAQNYLAVCYVYVWRYYFSISVLADILQKIIIFFGFTIQNRLNRYRIFPELGDPCQTLYNISLSANTESFSVIASISISIPISETITVLSNCGAENVIKILSNAFE